MKSKPNYDLAKRCFEGNMGIARKRLDEKRLSGEPDTISLFAQNLSVGLLQLTIALEMELSQLRASVEAISRRPRRIK